MAGEIKLETNIETNKAVNGFIQALNKILSASNTTLDMMKVKWSKLSLAPDTKTLSKEYSKLSNSLTKELEKISKKFASMQAAATKSGGGAQFSQAIKQVVEDYRKQREELNKLFTDRFKTLKANEDAQKESARVEKETQDKQKQERIKFLNDLIRESKEAQAQQKAIDDQKKADDAAATKAAQDEATRKINNARQNAILLKQVRADEARDEKKFYDDMMARLRNYAQSNGQFKMPTKQPGGGFSLSSFIGRAASTLTGVLGAFGIQASLSGIISGLQEATTAALDFAKAQYNLTVQVKAAQQVLGVQAAGTLTMWQNKIKELRKELGVYSNLDITKAVTQTSVLTRVLGLNAEKQEEVVRIASVLAQTTGTDLAQAVDDVTRALGGSSVVLDKYGLFIRDADKGSAAFQLGFTDKVLKGTQSLNSQQLALTTLKVIMDQVDPLYKSLGNYQDTLPGQMQSVNARIEDQTVAIGTNLTQWQLFGENLKSGFLSIIQEIANSDAFKAVNKFLENYNETAASRASAGVPDYKTYGLSLKAQGDQARFRKLAAQSKERGVPFAVYALSDFSEEDIKNNRKNIDRFLKDQEDAIDAFLKNQKRLENAERFKNYNNQTSTKQTGYEYRQSQIAPKTDPNAIDPEKLAELEKKYGADLIDAFKENTADLAQAELDRRNAIRKAGDDQKKAIEENGRKLRRALEDLDTDSARKRADIDADYQRGLDDIDRKSQEDRYKLDEDYQEKVLSNTEDFYDSLKDLEDQYYFDLRDAVADNDAVAIKKLERKFNLDKSKLEDNLDKKNADEESSYNKSLERLQQETEDRKAELDRRRDQERADLQTEEDRKREDLMLNQQRELDDLRIAYEEQRQEIEDQYDETIQSIDDKYQDRLNMIADKLADEEGINANYINQILQDYDNFIGENGSLTEMWREYYTRLQNMQGIYVGQNNAGINFDQLSQAGYIDSYSQPNPNPNPSGAANGGQINVNVSLDQEILQDTVVEVIGDVFADNQVYYPNGSSLGQT